MIKHENWDRDGSGDVSEAEQPYMSQAFKLPLEVTSICVSHDGGRLTIEINGEQVFYACEGTRDCTVTLDSSPLPDSR